MATLIVSGCQQQVNHYVRTFNALFRNCRFVQRCESSNYFIRSLQQSDVFLQGSSYRSTSGGLIFENLFVHFLQHDGNAKHVCSRQHYTWWKHTTPEPNPKTLNLNCKSEHRSSESFQKGKKNYNHCYQNKRCHGESQTENHLHSRHRRICLTAI